MVSEKGSGVRLLLDIYPKKRQNSFTFIKDLRQTFHSVVSNDNKQQLYCTVGGPELFWGSQSKTSTTIHASCDEQRDDCLNQTPLLPLCSCHMGFFFQLVNDFRKKASTAKNCRNPCPPTAAICTFSVPMNHWL